MTTAEIFSKANSAALIYLESCALLNDWTVWPPHSVSHCLSSHWKSSDPPENLHFPFCRFVFKCGKEYILKAFSLNQDWNEGVKLFEHYICSLALLYYISLALRFRCFSVSGSIMTWYFKQMKSFCTYSKTCEAKTFEQNSPKSQFFAFWQLLNLWDRNFTHQAVSLIALQSSSWSIFLSMVVHSFFWNVVEFSGPKTNNFK